MLVVIHPNGTLCSFKTSNNLPFCSSFRDDKMITNRVLSSSKNTYSKVLGDGLSSSFSGDSNDRLSFFFDGANCSTIYFHLLMSVDGVESSKVLTSSTNLTISNPNQSELNMFVKGHTKVERKILLTISFIKSTTTYFQSCIECEHLQLVRNVGLG